MFVDDESQDFAAPSMIHLSVGKHLLQNSDNKSVSESCYTQVTALREDEKGIIYETPRKVGDKPEPSLLEQNKKNENTLETKVRKEIVLDQNTKDAINGLKSITRNKR